MQLGRILVLLATCCPAQQPFGNWKLNATRSTFAGASRPKTLAIRIEPHLRGEVVTLDRTEMDGRSTTTSTILYFDGRGRESDVAGCSGTESSRRFDGYAVEIVRKCTSGESSRLVRRLSPGAKDLVLDITGQRANG